MARRIRRAPLLERILAYCNIMDLLLWLSEELETRDWDSNAVGTQVGIAASLLFMVARASTETATDAEQELFGDGGGTGWRQYLAVMTVWILIPFSVLNAMYALGRTRQYRLFESNVEQIQPTPSASRVKVNSAPVASSPLRFVSNLLTSESAEARSHPDSTRDVWELSVWNPLPASLRLLCIFSPGHVLLYTVFLPLAQLDGRPSVSVAKCVLLQIIMTAQMLILTSQYTRQIKDQAIIQKEVMNEYDTKFVRPRLHPIVRDVAVQVDMTRSSGARDSIQVGTPTTLINRGFQTHPNPNYVSHVDPDGSPLPSAKPRMFTSAGTGLYASVGSPHAEGVSASTMTTPLMHRSRTSRVVPAAVPPIAANFNATPSRSTANTSGANFGGSMGVYTHHKSPLKKPYRGVDLDDRYVPSPRNSREMAAIEQSARHTSPVKELKRLPGLKSYGERYHSRV